MLRVRIHHQSDAATGFKKVWDRTLTGASARETSAQLKWMGADPMLDGEILSLRIKDGEGGGCETKGCFLELEITELHENSEIADVYFHADKWRKW